MTDDLVYRLRNPIGQSGSDFNAIYWYGITKEAADRIERLETEIRQTSSWDRQMQKLADEQTARIEQLEALLKVLDDKFSSYKPYFGAEHSCNVTISFALIEDIRAALAGEKKDAGP